MRRSVKTIKDTTLFQAQQLPGHAISHLPTSQRLKYDVQEHSSMHSRSPSRPFSVLHSSTATYDVEIPTKDTDLKFARPEEHRSVRDVVIWARARNQTGSANLLNRTRNFWGVQIVMFGEFVARQVFFSLLFFGRELPSMPLILWRNQHGTQLS